MLLYYSATLLKSPRKMFIYTIKICIRRIKVSKTKLFNFEESFTGCKTVKRGSVFVLAETSARSPRKLLILFIKRNICRVSVSQTYAIPCHLKSLERGRTVGQRKRVKCFDDGGLRQPVNYLVVLSKNSIITITLAE